MTKESLNVNKEYTNNWYLNSLLDVINSCFSL